MTRTKRFPALGKMKTALFKSGFFCQATHKDLKIYTYLPFLKIQGTRSEKVDKIVSNLANRWWHLIYSIIYSSHAQKISQREYICRTISKPSLAKIFEAMLQEKLHARKNYQ